MTLAPTPKQPAPREPNYLDLRRIEAANAKAADLDIALAHCGSTKPMMAARTAIGNAVRAILTEMLRGDA